MKHVVTSMLVLAGVLATVNGARAQELSTTAQAPASFQVIRLGDNGMSCEALITEINGLNGQLQATSNAMNERAATVSRNAMRGARGPGMGASTALNLGTMAASMIPGAGLFASVASQAASSAQMAQAQAAQEQSMRDMENLGAEMTAGSSAIVPVTQRIEHLSQITRTKGC
jgi:hypothetical protein